MSGRLSGDQHRTLARGTRKQALLNPGDSKEDSEGGGVPLPVGQEWEEMGGDWAYATGGRPVRLRSWQGATQGCIPW